MISKKLTIGGRAMVFSGEGAFLASVPDGVYEEDIFKLFRKFIRPTDRCVDVGANFGFTTAAMAMLCSDGHVLGIEASEKTFAYLERNIAATSIPNITVVNQMVGKQDDRKIFWNNPHEPGSSPGSSPAIFETISGHGLQPTELRTASLDRILRDRNFGPVHFIKIDCEGADLEVIESAPETLSTRPLILAEFNAHCLMNFARINPPDALDRLLTIFPFVYHVRSDSLQLIKDNFSFMTQHVLERHCVDNLLCSFTPLASLSLDP